MIWAGFAIIAVAVAALLLARRSAWPWTLVTLAVAALAYGFSGKPLLDSVPAGTGLEAQEQAGAEVAQLRAQLLEAPADTRLWGEFSSALVRAGRSEEAVEGLNFASRTLGPNADLQVQLGTTLIAHAGGLITPAAQLALGRASEIDPTHPAPLYFLGLAHLQSGEPANAIEAWSELAARTPPGAPWEADLQRKLRAARIMQEAGVGSGSAPPD